jgi:hypothetical protein
VSRPRGELRDPEERFFFLKCSAEQGCGELFSFVKGGPLAPACPGCGSPWLRGDPNEVPWADERKYEGRA